MSSSLDFETQPYETNIFLRGGH